jgi:hypothetical protein
MLHRVALVRRDVSEERNASNISVILVTQMMEAMRSSETSVFTRATPRNIPEEGILKNPRKLIVEANYHFHKSSNSPCIVSREEVVPSLHEGVGRACRCGSSDFWKRDTTINILLKVSICGRGGYFCTNPIKTENNFYLLNDSFA